MVGRPAEPLCPPLPCHGSVAAGSFHRPAQPARLGTCQTDPPVSDGGPDQDDVLLHHSTGAPGTVPRVHILLLLTNKHFPSVIINVPSC